MGSWSTSSGSVTFYRNDFSTLGRCTINSSISSFKRLQHNLTRTFIFFQKFVYSSWLFSTKNRALFGYAFELPKPTSLLIPLLMHFVLCRPEFSGWNVSHWLVSYDLKFGHSTPFFFSPLSLILHTRQHLDQAARSLNCSVLPKEKQYSEYLVNCIAGVWIWDLERWTGKYSRWKRLMKQADERVWWKRLMKDDEKVYMSLISHQASRGW